MKKLFELNCHMIYEKNNILEATIGHLVKTDGTNGFIKAFITKTEDESEIMATAWANNNRRALENGGGNKSFQLPEAQKSLAQIEDSEDTRTEPIFQQAVEYDFSEQNQHRI